MLSGVDLEKTVEKDTGTIDLPAIPAATDMDERSSRLKEIAVERTLIFPVLIIQLRYSARMDHTKRAETHSLGTSPTLSGGAESTTPVTRLPSVSPASFRQFVSSASP